MKQYFCTDKTSWLKKHHFSSSFKLNNVSSWECSIAAKWKEIEKNRWSKIEIWNRDLKLRSCHLVVPRTNNSRAVAVTQQHRVAFRLRLLSRPSLGAHGEGRFLGCCFCWSKIPVSPDCCVWTCQNQLVFKEMTGHGRGRALNTVAFQYLPNGNY